MRALLAALLVSLAVPAVASAQPGSAVLVGCDRDARVGTFDGRMDAVAGGNRMAMSFTLQVRPRGRVHWHRVRIPGFGAWHTSAPGRERYVYTKRVEGLVGPARYRVLVRFRWLDGGGAVVRSARGVSAACQIPDPRPDLRVAAVTVRPARTHYAVTVRNAGRSAAAPSTLQLDLGDGGAPLSADVGPLAPGARQLVVLRGRACASGAVVTATADATDAVDERNEADNARVVTCP
jgi:CARDB